MGPPQSIRVVSYVPQREKQCGGLRFFFLTCVITQPKGFFEGTFSRFSPIFSEVTREKYLGLFQSIRGVSHVLQLEKQHSVFRFLPNMRIHLALGVFPNAIRPDFLDF